MVKKILKKIWMKTCRVFNGDDMATQTAERNWLQDVARLSAGVQPSVVVDAGANRGLILDRMLKVLPDASFFAFEPNPDLGGALRQKYAALSNVTVEEAGLGAQDETAIFNVNRYDETSSFLPVSSAMVARECMKTERQVQVKKKRLDQYFQARNILSVLLLKMDVQGYELEVLKGAVNIVGNISMIYAEVTFAPVYEGQSDFSSLDVFLRAHDFRVFNMYNIGSSTKTGQIAAADVLWVNNRFIPYRHVMEDWELTWNAQHAR